MIYFDNQGNKVSKIETEGEVLTKVELIEINEYLFCYIVDEGTKEK